MGHTQRAHDSDTSGDCSYEDGYDDGHRAGVRDATYRVTRVVRELHTREHQAGPLWLCDHELCRAVTTR